MDSALGGDPSAPQTTLRPGDPVWDSAWIPAAPGWVESVDDDEDAWVVNHPTGVDVGDAAMCWSAQLSTLRPRLELASPADGYCCQCLEITAAAGLVECLICGHGTHSNCAQDHRVAHAEF